MDLCNYATKSDLKNATGFDRSQFARKDNLPNLKLDGDDVDNDELKNVPSGLNSLENEIDKSDVGKLKPVPVDFEKHCDVVQSCAKWIGNLLGLAEKLELK